MMDPMIISARLDLSKPANIIRLIIEDIISAIKVTSKVLKKDTCTPIILADI